MRRILCESHEDVARLSSPVELGLEQREFTRISTRMPVGMHDPCAAAEPLADLVDGRSALQIEAPSCLVESHPTARR